MNAVTGCLVGLMCWALGVREPLLWGLIAFLFNFVPNIGSLIVAVPIAVLAWIDVGAGRALLVVVVYLGVNQVIGSVIEPRLMGRKMGLSPLVVLLSLLFWGWLWGPVGMLLSVPLTMIVRTGLLETRDGRTLGVLLGPSLRD
jgi:predicted PurR-regulated permease PerM